LINSSYFLLFSDEENDENRNPQLTRSVLKHNAKILKSQRSNSTIKGKNIKKFNFLNIIIIIIHNNNIVNY